MLISVMTSEHFVFHWVVKSKTNKSIIKTLKVLKILFDVFLFVALAK